MGSMTFQRVMRKQDGVISSRLLMLLLIPPLRGPAFPGRCTDSSLILGRCQTADEAETMVEARRVSREILQEACRYGLSERLFMQ